MESIWLPISLLVIGMVLIVLELFVPSGGMVGLMAAVCLAAAIAFAFMISVTYGSILLVVVTITVPILLMAMIKIWPHTPIGKRLFSKLPTEEEVRPQGERIETIQSLVGKRGVAKTKMLPSGSITVDGKTYDAVTNGSPVEAGEKIEVISIRTNRIIVRPVFTRELDESNDDDILAQSPESLGIENWDEPLGSEE